MKHYLVKMNITSDTDFHLCFAHSVLTKATHSEKAIEIATRELNTKIEVVNIKSCKLVNNCDVSILKAYLD